LPFKHRMIRCVILGFCFCLVQFTHAQSSQSSSRYDSLYRELKRSPSDTSTIKIYHLLAEIKAENNPNQALVFEDSALAIAKKLNSAKYTSITLTKIGAHYRAISEYQKSSASLQEAIKIAPPSSPWLGQTYLESGITLLRMSHLDSAMRFITQGLELIKKYPDRDLEASYYNLIGNIKRQENKYEQALENYIKSVKLFEQQNNLKGLTQALSNVGNIHSLIGNTDKALEYALESLETAIAANVKSSIAYSHRLIGRIYRKQDRPDEALRAYKDAMVIYRQLGDRRDYGETQLSVGNIYYDKGQFREAANEYQSALNLFRTLPDPFSMSYCYLSAGNTYIMLQNYKLAKDYLDSAISISVKHNASVVRMDSYALLSDIYEKQGDYKLSKEYLNRHFALRDSVNQVQNRKAVAEIEARYESEKKDDAIRILNAENELKATQIKSKNNERNYLLIFLALSVALAGIIYNRYKVKQRANEKLKELDQIKSRFFSNVSHEFRTPLSLIIGPLEEKLKKIDDTSGKEDLLMMHRNAKRLQNLINQLLDLSKIEAGSMELHLQEGELSSVIRLIGSTFSSLAERKGLIYKQEIFHGPYKGCYDRDKLEKMLNNLLSNAFKFTPEGGLVNMKATINDGKVFIEVKDSGIGIPEEKLGVIFNRFYQIDDSITRSSEGSGIGLALTKELAELHRGTLSASSREGIGSIFSLVLPITREAFRDLPVAVESLKEATIGDPSSSEYEPLAVIDTDESKPLILVAEDNTDMQRFIYDLLKEKYRVVCVSNGKEAFERAKAIVPDIVITDWMMPIMDGLTCCEKIKTTDATCHIPVLMLTARADQSSKLEGLETGADDYLVKPFNTHELTVRVHNLIEQRKKLREVFSKEIILMPKEISLPSRDAIFLTNLLALLEKKYADPDFSVEELSEEVSMSRMQLHRKLKALTDQSPGEFLRRFRLERAKQLLSVDGMQVSEVCFKVGFNNVSHFSKAFRDFTGITPTEFIESVTVKNKML
jgi:signal transduction histidine kinase/DNA-binding response OmpR family regulator